MSDLGKIFISYSSPDRAFVRRLVRSIEQQGFSVWLDARELRAGDTLTEQVSAALNVARVILVIVSAASLQSRWLRYELGLATERMIRGECRVIPVVIGDAELPPEVMGLLYADFRKDFRLGIKSVVTALQHERSCLKDPEEFAKRVDRAVTAAFGTIYTVSKGRTYRDETYQVVEVPVPSGYRQELGEFGWTEEPQTTLIYYDVLPRAVDTVEPLNKAWLKDLQDLLRRFPSPNDRMDGRSRIGLALIVTAKPLEIPTERWKAQLGEISFHTFQEMYFDSEIKNRSVFVQAGDALSERLTVIIEQARNLLIELAEKRQEEVVRDWRHREDQASRVDGP